MTDPADRRDPGLQPERTRLSWRRTALTGTVVSTLALRLVLLRVPGAVAVTLVALIALGWLTLLMVVQHRIRALAGTRPDPIGSRLPVVVATVVMMAAVLATITALFPGSGP